MYRDRKKAGSEEIEVNTEELINQDLDDILNGSQRGGGDDEYFIERDLESVEEKHKAKMLHVETLRMMAKYQILFVKMQGKLDFLVSLFAMKKKEYKIVVLQRLVLQKLNKTNQIHAVRKFESAVEILNSIIVSSYHTRMIGKSFNQIKQFSSIQNEFQVENTKIIRLKIAFEKAKASKAILKRRSSNAFGGKPMDDSDGRDKTSTIKYRQKPLSELEYILKTKKSENKKLTTNISLFQDKILGYFEEISSMMSSILQAKQPT